jgi:hypothetical protein
MSTTDLVRVAPAPLLPMEPAQAALMMDRYRQLCESILTADDVIGVPGRPGGFVKRSGWSKLATFYGASTEIMELTVERDDDGQPIRARAVVRATAANGRHADGDGACAINEPRFRSPTGRQKAEHDLPATAVTRATNRSVSNLIGFGSVSAEEVEPEEAPRPYGEVATRGEEDGLLRALEDLGAGPGPANRIVQRTGYMPKVCALSVMFVAAEVVAKRAGNGEVTTPPESAPQAASGVDTDTETPVSGDG